MKKIYQRITNNHPAWSKNWGMSGRDLSKTRIENKKESERLRSLK